MWGETLASRPALREERHPNSVTAPPVNRGSMTPRPWRGFWNSIGTGLLVRLGAGNGRQAAPAVPEAIQPWQRAAGRRRNVFMLLAVLSTVLAATTPTIGQPSQGRNGRWNTATSTMHETNKRVCIAIIAGK